MTVPGVNRVDLDDSQVILIHRESDRVAIELEQRRGHETKQLVVRLLGVTREDAEYYIGHNVTAPHPDPDTPLDYIEYAEQGQGYLELGGYLNNESWFVWRLVSTQIEIAEKEGGGAAT